MIITQKALPPRREWDFYPTPESTVRSALSLIEEFYLPDVPYNILDPGAGAGPWGKVARELWPAALIDGVEIRDTPPPAAYSRWLVAPFEAVEEWEQELYPQYDMVIGNPPFVQAEQFIRLCLMRLRPRGHLVFLLRLAFLESQRRARGLFYTFPPKTLGVLAKRPSFTGDGKTNATAFAVFHWQQGHTAATECRWLL